MAWPISLLAGVAIGVFSGSGIGGGTLLFIYMTALVGVLQNLAQGVNLLCFLPTAVTTPPTHIKNGYIDCQTVWPAVLAGLAGTALAVWTTTNLDIGPLHHCFSGFLIVVGLQRLFGHS